MPQLRFHAVSKDQINTAAHAMTTELAQLVGCAREHFVLEHIDSDYFWDGEKVIGYPFVEVYCFDRGEQVFDKMAESITHHMLAAGCPSVDVAFMLLERRRYYEDGKHL